MVPKFIVMTATARMPASCRGTYRRVAIVETDGLNHPKQINPTHAAVVSIRRSWERLNVGKTDSCAFQRALRAATEMASLMNAAYC